LFGCTKLAGLVDLYLGVVTVVAIGKLRKAVWWIRCWA
jgi:hypothetical protein